MAYSPTAYDDDFEADDSSSEVSSMPTDSTLNLDDSSEDEFDRVAKQPVATRSNRPGSATGGGRSRPESATRSRPTSAANSRPTSSTGGMRRSSPPAPPVMAPSHQPPPHIPASPTQPQQSSLSEVPTSSTLNNSTAPSAQEVPVDVTVPPANQQPPQSARSAQEDEDLGIYDDEPSPDSAKKKKKKKDKKEKKDKKSTPRKEAPPQPEQREEHVATSTKYSDDFEPASPVAEPTKLQDQRAAGPNGGYEDDDFEAETPTSPPVKPKFDADSQPVEEQPQATEPNSVPAAPTESDVTPKKEKKSKKNKQRRESVDREGGSDEEVSGASPQKTTEKPPTPTPPQRQDSERRTQDQPPEQHEEHVATSNKYSDDFEPASPVAEPTKQQDQRAASPNGGYEDDDFEAETPTSPPVKPKFGADPKEPNEPVPQEPASPAPSVPLPESESDSSPKKEKKSKKDKKRRGSVGDKASESPKSSPPRRRSSSAVADKPPTPPPSSRRRDSTMSDADQRAMAEEQRRIADAEAAEQKEADDRRKREEAEAARKKREEERQAKEAQRLAEAEERKKQQEAREKEERAKQEEDAKRRAEQQQREAEELEKLREEQAKRQARKKQLEAAMEKKQEQQKDHRDGQQTPTEEEAQSQQNAVDLPKAQEEKTKEPTRRGSTQKHQRNERVEQQQQDVEESTPQPGEMHARQLRIPTKMHAPHPREKHSAVMFNNNLFVFGGLVRNHAENSMIAFNTKSREWKMLPSLGERPPPFSGHSATVYQGKMVVIGGYTSAMAEEPRKQPVGTKPPVKAAKKQQSLKDDASVKLSTGVGVLDLTTLKWTHVPGEVSISGDGWAEETRDPNVTKFHTAVEHNGSVFVFGGVKDGGARTNDLDVLDLRKMQWTSTQDVKQDMNPPPPRAMHTANKVGVSGAHMLIFGGKDAVGDCCNDCYTFCFETHQYAELPTSGDQPSARAGHASCVTNGGQRMFVFGGSTAFMKHANDLHCLEYAGPEATAMWSRIDLSGEIPSGRQFSTLFPVGGDSLALFGGGGVAETEYNASTYSSCGSLHMLTPVSDGDGDEHNTTEDATQREREQLQEQAFSNPRRRPQSASAASTKQRSRRPTSAATTGSLERASTKDAPLTDEQLLHRYNRFNMWRMGGAFMQPAVPPNCHQKSKLSAAEQQKMAERLCKLPSRQQKIADMKKAIGEDGDDGDAAAQPAPRDPNRKTIAPSKVAENLYTKVVEIRQKKREQLLNKYLPGKQKAHRLDEEEMDNCTKRLYDGSIMKSEKTREALGRKYMSQPPKSRKLDEEEMHAAGERLYTASVDKKRKEKEKLANKYLRQPKAAPKLSSDEMVELSRMLYKGEKREMD